MLSIRSLSLLMSLCLLSFGSLAREQPLSTCQDSLVQRSGGYIEGYEGNPFGNAIDRFLSWFGIGSAPGGGPQNIEVLESDLQGSALAQNMLRLAKSGALLNQSDKRLNQFQLLVANGGLCVSTSVLNSLGASCNTNSEQFQKLAPVLITLLVQIYPHLIQDNLLLKGLSLPAYQPGEDPLFTITRPLLQIVTDRLKDARYGALSASVFLKPFQDVMRSHNIRFKLDNPPDLQTLLDSSRTNSMMIVTASIRDRIQGHAPSLHGRHAMVLLRYLPNSGEVVVSDPNQPNRIFKEKLLWDREGRLFFPLRASYTANGSYAYLEEIQVIEGP